MPGAPATCPGSQPLSCSRGGKPLPATPSGPSWLPCSVVCPRRPRPRSQPRASQWGVPGQLLPRGAHGGGGWKRGISGPRGRGPGSAAGRGGRRPLQGPGARLPVSPRREAAVARGVPRPREAAGAVFPPATSFPAAGSHRFEGGDARLLVLVRMSPPKHAAEPGLRDAAGAAGQPGPQELPGHGPLQPPAGLGSPRPLAWGACATVNPLPRTRQTSLFPRSRHKQ